MKDHRLRKIVHFGQQSRAKQIVCRPLIGGGGEGRKDGFKGHSKFLGECTEGAFE